MSDQQNQSRQASPDQLEERADAKRASINRTLSQLEDKFSPGQIVDQAVGLFRDHGGEMAENLGRTAKQNPMPLLLTGIGLAWLAASQNSSNRSTGRRLGSGALDRGQRTYGSSADWDSDEDGFSSESYASRTRPHHLDSGTADAQRLSAGTGPLHDQRGDESDDSTMMDTVREQADAVSDRVGDGVSATRDAARRGGRQGQQLAREVSRDARDFMQEQPLVVGAIGVALGAAIGALLPPTRAEDRVLGAQSNELTDQAQSMTLDAIRSSRERVESRAEELGSQARQAVEDSSVGEGNRKGSDSSADQSDASTGKLTTA